MASNPAVKPTLKEAFKKRGKRHQAEEVFHGCMEKCVKGKEKLTLVNAMKQLRACRKRTGKPETDPGDAKLLANGAVQEVCRCICRDFSGLNQLDAEEEAEQGKAGTAAAKLTLKPPTG